MRIRTFACLLILFATGIVAPAYAQIGQNEAGILVGMVSSTLAGQDANNVGRKIGFMAELQLVHPFTTQIGLKTGFGVAQKGASLALTASGTDKSSLKLSYFEVPALLRVAFAGRYAKVRPAVFFGPAAGLNVACKYKIATLRGGSVESPCDPDGPEIKAFDFSMIGGGSIEVGNFGGFVRYDHGFVTIDNSGAGDKVYNRAIIVGIIWNNYSR